MSASDVATLVKQAVDIADVIGQSVPLRRVGNRHVGLCPFHKEKTPSFQVDVENQLYYCFGCGSGGDVLSFVMKHQNLSFGEAVRYLADRYHIVLPEKEGSYSASSGAAEASRKEREQLYSVLQVAADFFYSQLHHSEAGRIARDYIERRRLPQQVVETERLGYASAQWDGLLRRLQESGIDPELGIKAGLLSKAASERIYDRFRHRLIFPIADDRGRIVGFGGRSLSTDSEGEPKYLNSPETPVYHKGRMLYQLAKARDACREVRQVVLVEGYMDLLAFHAHGFYRVAATLGTALTPHQVRLLARIADEVVLSYDADEAGQRAMLRALPLFLQEGLPVTSVHYPQGMDPDDFLKAEGLPAFEALLRQRQDLGMVAIQKALESWDGSLTGKERVLSEVSPLFEVLRQPVLKSEYLRLLADRLSLSETVIQKQLQHGKPLSQRSSAPSHAPTLLSRIPQAQSLEERIVRVMIKYPDLIEEVDASGAVEHFQESRLKALAQTLVQVPRPPGGRFEAGAVYDGIGDSELKELFTRFLLESGDLSEARLHLLDWLEALREGSAKQKRIEALNEALRQAQHRGDKGQVRNLLAQVQELCSSAKNRAKDRSR